jgi:hypothetical protein
MEKKDRKRDPEEEEQYAAALSPEKLVREVTETVTAADGSVLAVIPCYDYRMIERKRI